MRSFLCGVPNLCFRFLAGLLVGSCALGAAVSGGGASCVPVPAGLVAWWPGDAGALDQTGQSNGVLMNGAGISGGMIDTAFEFVGGASRVLVPETDSLKLQDLTLEMWIRRSNTTVSSDSPAGAGLFACTVGGYGMVILNGGGIGLGSVGGARFDTPPRIVDLEWHHVAATRAGSSVSIYVDGVLTDSGELPATFTFSGPFAIGATPAAIDGYFFSFLGSIDDLAVFNRALTASEIGSIWLAGAAGKCRSGDPGPNCEPAPSGLAAWFPLDEDSRNLVSPERVAEPSAATFGVGHVNGAAYFDGLAPGVVLPDDPRLKSQDFSVETWIKRESTTRASQSEPANGAIFAGGINSYGLAMDVNGALYFSVVGQQNLASSALVTDLAWHHVAMTKSGATVRIYLDGSLGGTLDVGNLQLDLSTPFAIGSLSATWSNGYNYSFWGGIDELSVYDRPLTSEEVFRIWARGAAGKCREGLALSLEVPPEVVEGTSFDYNLTVTNPGTNAVSGVVVTNPVPAGFQVTSTQAGVGTATVIAGDPGPTVVFSAGDLAPGAQAGLRVTLGNSPLGRQRLDALAVHAGSASPVTRSASFLVRPLCSPVPVGLVAWWKGDSNALDTISGINSGTFGGVTYTEGRIGAAFRFDGQSGTGVNVGQPSALQRSEFSVEGWLRRASSATVSPQSAGGTILGADANGWNFVLLNNGALSFGRSDVSAVVSAPVVTDRGWHHVAVSCSATEVRLYRDGELVLSQAYSETFKLDQAYGIGGIFPSGRNALLGDLDEIAVYDRILSAGELQAIASAGGAPKCVEDLVLTSDSGGPIALGEDWDVIWSISSVGSTPSTAVTFTNSVPAGLLLVSAGASQGTIQNLAGVLQGDLGTVPAGSNVVVRVVLRPLVAGTYVLSATTGRQEPELSLANNRMEISASAATLSVGLDGDVRVVESAVAEFNVRLNAPTVKTVTVAYATVAGTATAGADFEPQSGTLEFAPGTVEKTVRIPIVADGFYELEEAFTLELSGAVNAVAGLSRAVGTIVSEDPLPVADVRPVLQAEGNAGVTPYRFEISLDRPSGMPASFRYATVNDSAKAPTDFTAAEGIVLLNPGETRAVIEVGVNADTAVEPNEAFLLQYSEINGLRFATLPPPLGVATIINDDAVSGLVTAFAWDTIPSAATVRESWSAALSARDGTGAVVPAFNGVVGVQAFAGPGLPSRVILTDVSVQQVRGVELQNVSPESVDVGGWVVSLYDDTRWPAPRVSFVIPAGTLVRASEVFVVEVTTSGPGISTYPRFRVAGSLSWASRTPQDPVTIGVVVSDASGTVQDSFFAGAAVPAEVGVPALLTDLDWSGPAAQADPEIGVYFRPPGQNRNGRQAMDWGAAAPTFPSVLGRPNPGLVLPFADAVPLAVVPGSVAGFTGGVWQGLLSLNGYAPVVRLLADDGNGHRALSGTMRVTIVDDLSVTMTATPSLLTGSSWESRFDIRVTNLGPVLSSNVTARVLLSPAYGSVQSALQIPPQVSQGTVSNRTLLNPIIGAQSEITAFFGDLPAGGAATLTVVAARTPGGRLTFPSEIESLVSLTRQPEELNLLNNTASAIQEVSRPCTSLNESAVAWWRAEGNFEDDLGGHHGSPVGTLAAIVGDGRVGRGSFAFEAAGDGVRVPDAAALDISAGESFSLEMWFRVPSGSPVAMALISKAQISEGVLTGYSLGLEGTQLVLRLGGGGNSNEWRLASTGIGAANLRDGDWHHLVMTVSRSAEGRVQGWVDGGALQGQGAIPFPDDLSNDAPLRFAEAVPGSTESSLAGGLDEVVFYRRVLTAAEVRAAYEAGGHGHCTATLALTAVSPRFTVEGPIWTGLDSGVAGRPYRYEFLLSNQGPLAANARIFVYPGSDETNFTLVTPTGRIPFDPDRVSAVADLGSLAPGAGVPLAVEFVESKAANAWDLVTQGTEPGHGSTAVQVRINLLADTDRDGIPDDVERSSGLDPASPGDAGSDTDRDGFTASQEFEAGTAANDIASALRLTVVEGQVVMEALASRVYRLERRESLDHGTWDLIQATRPLTDGVLVLGPLPGEAGSGYYRVTASLPY